LSAVERCRQLTDAYRAEGGTAPCVLIRRVWVGDPPRQRLDDQLDVYRGYSSSAAMQHWGSDELVTAPDGTGVADGLMDVMDRAGADCVNLRIHVPGVGPQDAREQIERLGQDVLGKLSRVDQQQRGQR
jgi:hypothetical protein